MSRKIIIITDDKNVGDRCSVILSDFEYDVFCAYSLDNVTQYVEENVFDLVILSEKFFTLSGINVFQNVREITPTISGILLVESTDFVLVSEAVNIGFGRICKKPIVADELIDYVQAMLNIVDIRDEIARMEMLLPLYELGERFIVAEDEQAIYSELVSTVSTVIDVSSVSVMTLDDDTSTLKIVAERGLSSEIVRKAEIKLGEKIAGKVFLSRRPVILNRQSQHLSPFINVLKRKDLAAAISFPMIRKGLVFGVLNVSQVRDGAEFSNSDIEMLSILSGQATLALENIKTIKEREENSRVRALFEQYVSPDLTGLLMEQGHNPMELGSVQVLTVLFADIRNFTLLVQHLNLDLMRSFLNSFFDLFANIIFSYKGMLDKFMGDGALVIFGAPAIIADPDAVSVKAAQQIILEFEKLRLTWEEKSKVFSQIGLGIGISRGRMFLGNVGSSRRLDYTVIGTDVNIAQRLASETLSGQILITDKVYENLNDTSFVVAEPSRTLKGMEHKTTIYSINELSH